MSKDSIDWREQVYKAGKDHQIRSMELRPEDRKYLRPYLNDPIVVDVLEKYKERADEGMKKYGKPMTRTDIDTLGWLRHAQEEAMDLVLYLERAIKDLEKK